LAKFKIHTKNYNHYPLPPINQTKSPSVTVSTTQMIKCRNILYDPMRVKKKHTISNAKYNSDNKM